MRAHFRVIRVNRWGVALVILAALALLLLPGSKFLPVLGALSEPDKIHDGVTALKRDFSGRSEAEAKAMLAQMAVLYRGKPQPAYAVRATEGYSYVIPEVNGYELDVDATWNRLIHAKPNTVILPATRIVTPSKQMSDFPASIIRHGNPAKPNVGLLINVDWGEEELPRMLETLRTRGARVTFFVSGRWAAKNKDLMASMVAGGHEVASHGHVLTEDGPAGLAKQGKLKGDIETSVRVIEETTGVPVRYYAPHKSQISPAILKTADELKLRTVLYSVDTRDWMLSTTTTYIMEQFQKALPGDLILLHPKPNTAKVLDDALMGLQARGLTPVTLSELLSPEPETGN
ncbi:MAG TPA: polysaccharide deacetylase family protein [Symbiobacteriaceae bacterium]|nr:polysaccharide deacetylase family protein [Symbiobacteriaceae bacterium]